MLQNEDFMANVLLVDDDVLFTTLLADKIEKTGIYKIAFTATSFTEAMDFLNTERPDIAILDIRLNGTESGLDLAKVLVCYGIPIVFITEFEDMETYRLASALPNTTFLVKPFHILTLNSVFENMLTISNFDNLKGSIVFRNGSLKQHILLRNILYVNCEGNYSTLVTKEKKFVYKLSLEKMIIMINNKNFIRISKNILVNTKFVTDVDFKKNTVSLENEKFPLGRKFKKEINSIFLNKL